MSDVTLTINGREVTVPAGSTILDAAKKLDIWIPTLCHMNLHGTEMDNHPASCRVCVVEVKGKRALMPSCATPVSPGMEVITNSARVLRARRTVVELLISDHPKACLTCLKNVTARMALVVRTAHILPHMEQLWRSSGGLLSK